jgi:ankyrin repeat protein
MLLRKSCKLNTLNHENWAPVHVASKRGAKECLQWIINQNKLLKKDVKENFDLNLKGKNKCSPLHISVICFRLEETFLLLEAGCDVFVKNMDGKSPRKVCYGNFLLSKLLRNYENYYLSSRFPSNEIIKETNYYITTVEENIKIDEYDIS